MIEIIKITQKENCSGCFACNNICPKFCISMECDDEGFRYPNVDLKSCIECGLCEKVCPIINKRKVENNPKAYACYNKNFLIRMESSSGGLFTLFAEYVIECGGVVFGAQFDKEFNVIHNYTETIEGLRKFRGSKYVQSIVGNMYKYVKDYLQKDRRVLFTGTPCQIAGLKAYLGREYDNLICIDFICHGVPSPYVWKRYLSFLKDKYLSIPKHISFRDKKNGWKKFSMSITFKNNKNYIKTLDKDLYLKAFLKDICLRESCYKCEFKTINRQSDITLADFWGIQNMIPEIDDDKGISLILINSKSGQDLFESIKDKIYIKEVDIDKAILNNPAATKSACYNPKRENFFYDLDKMRFDKLVKKYCTDSFIFKIRKKSKSVVRRLMRFKI